MTAKVIQVLKLFYAKELREPINPDWNDKNWVDIAERHPSSNSLVMLKLKDLRMVKSFYHRNWALPSTHHFRSAPDDDYYYHTEDIIAWMPFEIDQK